MTNEINSSFLKHCMISFRTWLGVCSVPRGPGHHAPSNILVRPIFPHDDQHWICFSGKFDDNINCHSVMPYRKKIHGLQIDCTI